MRIVKKKIGDLFEAPYNPRKISRKKLDKLKKSIEEFGYIVPIIWNKRTGHVVGGNQRLKALRILYGRQHEVEVVEIDVDIETEKKLAIALNKIEGEWDYDKLKDILEEIDEYGKIELTGFDKGDVDIPTFGTDEGFEIGVNTVSYDTSIFRLVIDFDDMNKYEFVKGKFKELKAKHGLRNNAEVLKFVCREVERDG